jgi:hypothetical protein
MIIDLYRGLMNILVEQNLQLEKRMVEHIRPFHAPRKLDPGISSIFNGFWNFMLEICMVLFSKFIFIFGILIITALAIIFFPLNFVISTFTFAAKDGDYQLAQTQVETQPKETESLGKVGSYSPGNDIFVETKSKEKK